jgi:ADP-ribosylglycohydrolase
MYDRLVPMTSHSVTARARSSLVAGAIGEISPTILPHAAVQPSLFPPPHPRAPMHWLALATCEAVVRDGGRVDPHRIAAVLVEWFGGTRSPDLDRATQAAIRALAAGAPAAEAGAHGEEGSGSSAVIRTAPLAFLLDPGDPADMTILRDVVRLTDHGDDAYAAALALVVAVRASLTAGRVPGDMLATVTAALPPSRVRERLTALQRLTGDTPGPTDDNGRREAADAVAIGLLAATRHADDLEAACAAALAAGGDAAGAAVAGHVLGAAGCRVAVHLLDALPDRALVESVLEPFVQIIDNVAI